MLFRCSTVSRTWILLVVWWRTWKQWGDRVQLLSCEKSHSKNPVQEVQQLLFLQQLSPQSGIWCLLCLFYAGTTELQVLQCNSEHRILPWLLRRLHGPWLTWVQEIPTARFVSSEFSHSNRELQRANPFIFKIEGRVAWGRTNGSLLHPVDKCNVWNKLFNFRRSRKNKCLSIPMAENQPNSIPNACSLPNDHCWQGTKWPRLWDYTKLFGHHLLSSNWVGCTALCWDDSRKGNWSTPFFVWGKPARELIKQEGNWVRYTSGRLNLICAPKPSRNIYTRKIIKWSCFLINNFP